MQFNLVEVADSDFTIIQNQILFYVYDMSELRVGLVRQTDSMAGLMTRLIISVRPLNPNGPDGLKAGQAKDIRFL